jgi:hypothetical protein
LAEPAFLYFLDALREIPHLRGPVFFDAVAAGFADRFDPFPLRLKIFLRGGDLRGVAGFHLGNGVVRLFFGRVTPGPELAGKLVLPLRETRRGPPEMAQQFKTPVDAEIDSVTHNRS